jgi:hypothetical protein
MAPDSPPASPDRKDDLASLGAQLHSPADLIHAARAAVHEQVHGLTRRVRRGVAARETWRAPRGRLPRVFVRPEAPPADAAAARVSRDVLVDWAILTLAVLAYCARFLDLATQRPLVGNEAEVFQALDYAVLNSLQAYGRFPLWNPYLASGLPLVADPFLHVFDPLATIPVLLFGVVAGFKIALFLSFLAAALGAWLLGRVLGLSRPVGLWLALMYAFSGQAVAKFVQGQYDFVLGFAWIPWVVAGLFLVVRTRRRAHAALAALSLALLFFAGNLYYAYYMVFVVALFAATAVLTPRLARPFVTLEEDRLRVLLVVGGLALGLVAVQLLPVAEFLPHFGKATDPQLTESHTPEQIWHDLTSTELKRPDAVLYSPLQPEEYYAYMGLLPFVALLLVPLAVTRRSRRTVLFFVLLAGFAVLWIDLRDTPLRDFYAQNTMLQQFRYPTRFLVYGAFAVLVLAALGLDALWRRCAGGLGPWRGLAGLRWRAVAPAVALGFLSGCLLWSLLDVANQNRQVMATREPDDAARAAVGWLARADRSNYYLSAPSHWHAAVLSQGMRFLDAWYGVSDIRSPVGQLNRRTVQARAHYAILPNDAPPPQAPGAAVFGQLAAHTVYRLPRSLPFAFTASNATIADPDAAELTSDDVAAVPALIANTDAIEIIADGQPEASLVVLVAAYPGWQLSVDGRQQPLVNVGGYLAAALQPGVHKYAFTFDLASFRLGLLLSLAALLAVLGLLWSDARVLWRSLVPAFAPRPGYAGPRVDWRERAAWGRGRAATTARWLVHDAAWTRPRWAVLSLGGALFLVALGVYAITRFVALDQFPIYFFADEAIEPVLASDLLQRGLHDARGNFLPVFFDAYGFANPLISVYAHVLSISLFGKSVEVTRGTAAFITLLGAAGVALALRTVFHTRCWWAAVLVLAVMPAWFLHSRTGFEAVIMASFYAWFLLCYLLYRCRSPRFLYPAVVFAALTFYSYGNGQMVIGAAALLLFFADLRYHLRNWRTLLPAFVLLVVLAVPFFQWRTQTPQAIDAQLTRVGSYLVMDRPLPEKVLQFTRQYVYGLSPNYWFVPNERDLARHRVDGLGNLPGVLFPFFLLGIGVCLWRVRQAPYRTVLLAALATPVGGAISEVGILRVIAFVVPATLFSVLGLELLLARLRAPRAWSLAAGTVAALLVAGALWLLQYALGAGPYWFRDYGLYGMQWGASQVFEQVRDDLQANPTDRYYVSSTWANGSDVFLRFFLPGEPRVQIGHVSQLAFGQQPLDDHMVFVMTAPEYAAAQANAKFKSVQADRVLPYPDGTPGFYWARLAYADNAAELFAAEQVARRELVTVQVPWQGEALTVRHSQTSAGEAAYLFDGKSDTLLRGLEANPFILEVVFPSPRPLAAMAVQLGSMAAELQVTLTGLTDDEVARYESTEPGTRQDPVVTLAFDHGPPQVTKVRLEAKDLRQGSNPAQIHIREVTFR